MDDDVSLVGWDQNWLLLLRTPQVHFLFDRDPVFFEDLVLVEGWEHRLTGTGVQRRCGRRPRIHGLVCDSKGEAFTHCRYSISESELKTKQHGPIIQSSFSAMAADSALMRQKNKNINSDQCPPASVHEADVLDHRGRPEATSPSPNVRSMLGKSMHACCACASTTLRV